MDRTSTKDHRKENDGAPIVVDALVPTQPASYKGASSSQVYWEQVSFVDLDEVDGEGTPVKRKKLNSNAIASSSSAIPQQSHASIHPSPTNGLSPKSRRQLITEALALKSGVCGEILSVHPTHPPGSGDSLNRLLETSGSHISPGAEPQCTSNPLTLGSVIPSTPSPTKRLQKSPPPLRKAASDSTSAVIRRKLAEALEDENDSQGSPLPMKRLKFQSPSTVKRPLRGAASDNVFLERPASEVKRLKTTLRVQFGIGSEEPVRIADSVLKGRPVIIAHDDSIMMFSEKNGIKWAVCYHIAYLITKRRLKWSDVNLGKLKELAGDYKTAGPLIESKLLNPDPEEESDTLPQHRKIYVSNSNKSPWEELEREDIDKRNGTKLSLGCQPNSDWYGGKVIFSGRLLESGKRGTDPYEIVLEKAETGASCRFARQYGSESFLRIKIPKKLQYALPSEGALSDPSSTGNNKLRQFFHRPFILFGKVFRSYFAKDGTVHLFEAARGFSLTLSDALEDFSLLRAFLQWHFPLELNQEQGAAKGCSRMALGLSNTIPGCYIKPSNIHEIPDILAEGYDSKPNEKPPAEKIMTDGCGFINLKGMMQLREQLNWADLPSAVQCRVAGAKGILLLQREPDPTQESDEAKVFVRPSQQKIKYSIEELTDAKLIVDVIRPSLTKTPSALSKEFLMNLSHNGVRSGVLIGLMKERMKNIVDSLSDWEDETDLGRARLWIATASACGVMGARMARELAGATRAKGFSERDWDNDDKEVEATPDEDEETDISSSSGSIDPTSGCPFTLGEGAMGMLDSGFSPMSCPLLRYKLIEVTKRALNRYIKHFHIEVLMSASAFMVPDSTGSLKPGEIFFQSSEGLILPNNMRSHFLTGPVLVGRHPCKVPTDIQKVMAMSPAQVPKLAMYSNVIIFSTLGERSPASYLGGGDYDGDKATLIWQPEVVNDFTNADLSYSNTHHTVAVDTYKEDAPLSSLMKYYDQDEELISQLTPHLLSEIRNTSMVGRYSHYHLISVYVNGYAHWRTVRLAYMFCAVLDGSKTGLMVKKDVFKKDASRFEWRRLPKWAENTDKLVHAGEQANSYTCREGEVKNIVFIMDELHDAGRRYLDERMGSLMEIAMKAKQSVDPDLIEPYLAIKAKGGILATMKGSTPDLLTVLAELEAHVKTVGGKFKEEVVPKSPFKDRSPSRLKFADGNQAVRMRTLCRISAHFDEFGSDPDSLASLVLLDRWIIRRLLASCAYWSDASERSDTTARFSFSVAMRELCAIKAAAVGQSKTITNGFYEYMTVRGAVRRL